MSEFFTHTIAFVVGIIFTLFIIWLIAKFDGVDATKEDFESQLRKFNEYQKTEDDRENLPDLRKKIQG